MITLEDLKILKQILSIKAIEEKAGLNINILHSKLNQNSELSVTQSMNITKVLKNYGLTYEKPLQ